MIKVLFVSFESLPFVKTGGLADVVYALPKALDKEQFEVRVIMPLFKTIKEKYYDGLKYLDHIYVHSGFINEEANVYSYINEGIEYLFIENDTFFNRDGIYGYSDDAARFSFYNVAVLETMIKLDYYPDVCHEHDYHAAVLPALCKIRYNAIESVRNIKHILTIHNLAYQGEYDKQVLFDYLAFDYHYYENGDLRFNDYCNFMKIGIIFADYVTTVSRTYAQEIQTPEYSHNLDTVLRFRRNDLYGIVNGIDTDSFNPSTDESIYHKYNLRNYITGKRKNKSSLQYQLGLEDKPDTMLIGMVSRLTFQKGADLVLGAIQDILKHDVQVAILGTGESKYEYSFKMLEQENKHRFVYYCGYNEELAHSMYAGLDMLMMPSLFEPCGISQLIAMRYGTLPFVRETGGLKDTVEPLNEYTLSGTGFSFANYSVQDLLNVFEYAYTQYYDYPERWKMMIKNAMRYDVSFAKSAREYEDLYRKVLGQ